MWLKRSDEQVKTLDRFYTNALYFYYKPVGLSLANWRAESVCPPLQFLYEGEKWRSVAFLGPTLWSCRWEKTFTDARSYIIVGHQKIQTFETILSIGVILLTSAATHLSVGFIEFTSSPVFEISLIKIVLPLRGLLLSSHLFRSPKLTWA